MFAEPGSFIYGLTLSDPASIVVARYLEAVTGSIPNWEVQLSSVVTTVTHYAPRREAPGLGKFKALSPLNSRLNPSLLSGLTSAMDDQGGRLLLLRWRDHVRGCRSLQHSAGVGYKPARSKLAFGGQSLR